MLNMFSGSQHISFREISQILLKNSWNRDPVMQVDVRKSQSDRNSSALLLRSLRDVKYHISSTFDRSPLSHDTMCTSFLLGTFENLKAFFLMIFSDYFQLKVTRQLFLIHVWNASGVLVWQFRCSKTCFQRFCEKFAISDNSSWLPPKFV